MTKCRKRKDDGFDELYRELKRNFAQLHVALDTLIANPRDEKALRITTAITIKNCRLTHEMINIGDKIDPVAWEANKNRLQASQLNISHLRSVQDNDRTDEIIAQKFRLVSEIIKYPSHPWHGMLKWDENGRAIMPERDSAELTMMLDFQS